MKAPHLIYTHGDPLGQIPLDVLKKDVCCSSSDFLHLVARKRHNCGTTDRRTASFPKGGWDESVHLHESCVGSNLVLHSVFLVDVR